MYYKMNVISTEFLVFLITIILYVVQVKSNNEYVAAVVEYAPLDNDKTPATNMRRNIEKYEELTKEAKLQKADIIVFPEYGITTTSYEKANNLYTTIIPDPKDKLNICNYNNTSWSAIITKLSCAAQNNGIYLVANLLEREKDNSDSDDKKEFNIYNTNIVFDRSGVLIARYRKQNLFNEPDIDVTNEPDLTYFKTDFNVTFGTFTCFDILFSQPSLYLLKENKKITDIIYPTAWFSELPFLTAVQTQVGWARANGVNLLAASYSDPKITHGGSVIFQASGNISYYVSDLKENKLLVSTVKKIDQRITPEGYTNAFVSGNNNQKLSTSKENMTKYTTELLEDNVENKKLCHKDFCCTFTIKFTAQQNVDYQYRMVVYDGPRRFSNYNYNVQICGLAACKDKTKESCGERIIPANSPKLFDDISIKGEKFTDNGFSVIFPSQVLYSLGVLNPSDFTFKTRSNNEFTTVEMKTTKQVKEILGFGIYNVVKGNNNPSSHGLSGGYIALIVIILLLIVAFIVVGFLRFRKSKNSF